RLFIFLNEASPQCLAIEAEPERTTRMSRRKARGFPRCAAAEPLLLRSSAPSDLAHKKLTRPVEIDYYLPVIMKGPLVNVPTNKKSHSLRTHSFFVGRFNSNGQSRRTARARNQSASPARAGRQAGRTNPQKHPGAQRFARVAAFSADELRVGVAGGAVRLLSYLSR